MQIAALKKEYSFTPKSDQKSELQTIWTFRPPTLQDRIDWESALRMDTKSITAGDLLRRNCALIRACVTGVTNLADTDGNSVVWPKADPDGQNAILERIPSGIIREIADNIISAAFVAAEQKKSS